MESGDSGVTSPVLRVTAEITEIKEKHERYTIIIEYLFNYFHKGFKLFFFVFSGVLIEITVYHHH